MQLDNGDFSFYLLCYCHSFTKDFKETILLYGRVNWSSIIPNCLCNNIKTTSVSNDNLFLKDWHNDKYFNGDRYKEISLTLRDLTKICCNYCNLRGQLKIFVWSCNKNNLIMTTNETSTLGNTIVVDNTTTTKPKSKP